MAGLAERSLIPFELAQESAVAADACRLLDTRVGMDDYGSSRFESQLSNFISCVNSDHKHQDLVSSLSFLRDERTEDGRSYLDLQIDLLKATNLNQAEAGYLIKTWLASFDQFMNLLDGLPYWVSKKFAGVIYPAGDTAGPVLKPLFDLAAPLMKQTRDNLHRLLQYGAQVLRRPDAAQLIRFGDDLLEERPELEPTARASQNSYDFLRLMRWVGNKECQPSTRRDQRDGLGFRARAFPRSHRRLRKLSDHLGSREREISKRLELPGVQG